MQSKLTSLCLVIGVSILVVACNNKSDKKETKSDTTTRVVDVVEPKNTSPRLFCTSKGEDSLAIPHADVMLSLDGKETKVSSINACSEILKSDYQTYEIPENAVSAVGGFWAGLGSYFYLVEKDGKFVVFEGFTEEGQKEKGFHWKEWKSQ